MTKALATYVTKWVCTGLNKQKQLYYVKKGPSYVLGSFFVRDFLFQDFLLYLTNILLGATEVLTVITVVPLSVGSFGSSICVSVGVLVA